MGEKHWDFARNSWMEERGKQGSHSQAEHAQSRWLGRTHFSRSICYRFESCVTPTTPDNRLFWDHLLRTMPPTIIASFDQFAQLHESPLLTKHSGLARSLSFPNSSAAAACVMNLDTAQHNNSLNDHPSVHESFDSLEETYRIDLGQLFLGQKFASGTYGRVYHGIYKDRPVAVKFLREADDNEEIAHKIVRQFHSEVHMLSRILHPNIVEFIGACRKPPVCCIVTEYLPEGSLRAFLQKHEPYSLPLPLLIDMALDVAEGMNHLHSRGIIHRDLKSQNLLLSDDLCVKITDFGVSCFEIDHLGKMEDLGTFRWMAPEMISNNPHSRKVDIYSFGIVLWEMMTGQVPFEELTAVQAAFAVVHKNARPVIPPKCPFPLAELMKKCWMANPDKRPEFFEIVEALKEVKATWQSDMTFTAWQKHHKHTNILLHCFKGCLSNDLIE